MVRKKPAGPLEKIKRARIAAKRTQGLGHGHWSQAKAAIRKLTK